MSRSQASPPFGLLRWPWQRWLRCVCVFVCVCPGVCLRLCLCVTCLSLFPQCVSVPVCVCLCVYVFSSLCACVSVPLGVCVCASSSLCSVCVCVRVVSVCVPCVSKCVRLCLHLCLWVIFNEAFPYNVFDTTYKRVTSSSTLFALLCVKVSVCKSVCV